MANDIGSMNLKISLSDAGLQAGLKQAERDLAAFDKKAASLFSGGGLGGYASAFTKDLASSYSATAVAAKAVLFREPLHGNHGGHRFPFSGPFTVTFCPSLGAADHAFAMLLALTRQLPRFMANQAQGRWQPDPQGILVLKDKTAVVIGVGGAGFNIATRAWAFGMTVIGVDPQDYPMTPIVKRYVKPDQLDEVLPQADVVFVSAPHPEQSHRMLSRKQFDLMKQGAYFVAVSRGGLYDIEALVHALDSKRLSGAGVDVTDPEPLPKGHPLWKFPNAIVTPHVAGRSDQDWGRMVGTARENIKRFAAGKPLINVVDKQKGY